MPQWLSQSEFRKPSELRQPRRTQPFFYDSTTPLICGVLFCSPRRICADDVVNWMWFLGNHLGHESRVVR